MKLCDLCGSLDIYIDDGDVCLCKECYESLKLAEELRKKRESKEE